MIDKQLISRAKTLELSILSNGVALVVFDAVDSKVNLLSSAVIGELEQILNQLETPGFCKGVVFISAKANCFIAGADIKEILQAQTLPEEDVFAACQRGKAVLARIAALPIGTVAAIAGRCLGGGAELSLVCDVRIGSDDKSTVFGLPEVGLGVLPGWGGTVRAPQMFGLLTALRLTLNPLRPLSAKKAHKAGILSAVVPAPKLFDAAVAMALRLDKSGSGKTVHVADPLSHASNSWIGRAVILTAASLLVKAIFGRKYPAPQAVLTVLRAALEQPEDKSFELESRTFAQLCKTDASKRCVQKFLEFQKAKKAKSAAQ